MGEPTHAFFPPPVRTINQDSCSYWDATMQYEERCGLPRSAHPASPPERKPESEKCFVCGAQPVVMATGLCGPCTFGEAEMIGQSE